VGKEYTHETIIEFIMLHCQKKREAVVGYVSLILGAKEEEKWRR